MEGLVGTNTNTPIAGAVGRWIYIPLSLALYLSFPGKHALSFRRWDTLDCGVSCMTSME